MCGNIRQTNYKHNSTLNINMITKCEVSQQYLCHIIYSLALKKIVVSVGRRNILYKIIIFNMLNYISTA